MKNGKKVTVERKLVSGLRDRADGAEPGSARTSSTAIQGVIKFVGTGKAPLALRDDEVKRLLGMAEPEAESAPKEEIPFLVGQAVEITEGPFSDFSGVVEDVLADKGKVQGVGVALRAADDGRARLPAVRGVTRNYRSSMIDHRSSIW